jgi:nicotinamide-nucleotide amidase
MKPMFNEMVLPVLRQRMGEMVIVRRTLNTFGLTESGLDELAAPIYLKYTNPVTTILANEGQIELHLAAHARNEREAERWLDELSEQLEEALGDHVFSHRGQTLEQVVGELLTLKGYSLAVAESCTGGLLAARITDVPGSSKYFLQGVVSYSNEAKVNLLGVPNKLLQEHGAVSAEVAEAMAIGIRRRARSTIGVGITGIAGPDGGSETKPVGLVHIGLADDVQSSSRKFLFPGDRQLVRQLSVRAALDLVRRRVR